MGIKVESSWSIRTATSRDFAALRELYEQVWSFTRPSTYDHWRYNTCPFAEPAVSIAFHGSRPIGGFAFWPVRMVTGQETLLAGCAMDVMSHPDFVGKPVFVETAIHCLETAISRGFKLFYGFPNPASLPSFVRRLNWDRCGNATHWMRPIRPSGYYKVPKIMGPFADGLALLWPRGSKSNLEIRFQRPNEGQLSHLTKKWQTGRYSCRISRDTEWYDWRYATEAESNYEWISCYQDNELLAVAVWGMRTTEWGHLFDRRAKITELLGSYKPALQAVLNATIKRAWDRRAILLETVSTITTLEKVLKRTGFYRHGQIPLIVKDAGTVKLSTNIHEHSNWKLFGGDVDTF